MSPFVPPQTHWQKTKWRKCVLYTHRHNIIFTCSESKSINHTRAVHLGCRHVQDKPAEGSNPASERGWTACLWSVSVYRVYKEGPKIRKYPAVLVKMPRWGQSRMSRVVWYDREATVMQMNTRYNQFRQITSERTTHLESESMDPSCPVSTVQAGVDGVMLCVCLEEGGTHWAP